jgi:hypothetical protein
VGGKENRTIVILVGLYVAKQLVATAAADVGFSALADVVDVAWLAFCAYTWFAPTLFQRALAKELDEVELRDDF